EKKRELERKFQEEIAATRNRESRHQRMLKQRVCQLGFLTRTQKDLQERDKNEQQRQKSLVPDPESFKPKIHTSPTKASKQW
ncbi:unnamed protein product, partial [Chrysoparadoxa australica]